MILEGRSKAINKTVTVAEIVKRKAGASIIQANELYSVSETDVWDPIVDNMDV